MQFLPQLRNFDILCGDLLIQLDIAFLLLFIEGLIASSAGLFLDGFPILSLPFCRNNFPGFRIGLANQRALAAHLLLLRIPYSFLLLVNICHPYSFAFLRTIDIPIPPFKHGIVTWAYLQKGKQKWPCRPEKSWFAGPIDKRGNWPVTGCSKSRKKAPGE